MFNILKTISEKNSRLSTIIISLLYIEKKYPNPILKAFRIYFWQIVLNSQISPLSFSSDKAILTLRLAHPFMIIIHPQAKIGMNCTIYHGVTLGIIENKNQEAPILGNNIYIGCKATILGGYISEMEP